MASFSNDDYYKVGFAGAFLGSHTFPYQSLLLSTVNRERFAAPNFRGFEEDHESFLNILHKHLFNNYRYNISAPGQ